MAATPTCCARLRLFSVRPLPAVSCAARQVDDLLIGVADDRSIVGLEADRFENEDKFMLHLSHVIGAALGDRAGTCVDPRMQLVRG